MQSSRNWLPVFGSTCGAISACAATLVSPRCHLGKGVGGQSIHECFVVKLLVGIDAPR